MQYDAVQGSTGADLKNRHQDTPGIQFQKILLRMIIDFIYYKMKIPVGCYREC